MLNEITLLTFVSGNINGVDFCASGSGSAQLKKGITRSYLQYSNFPQDFTPLKCKSWKCKHHPAIAREIKGGLNLYSIAGGNYDVFETIRYPNNQVIYSSAKVRRIEPNFQIVISRFDGLCKGEVNIVKMLPYQEILIPQGKGKAIFRGERVVITNKGNEIKIRWDGELYFINKNVELPFEEVLFYTPTKTAKFFRDKLRYEKEMEVSISKK